MSITIENAEAEAILADLAARTRRPTSDLLLDLLRREQAKMESAAGRDSAERLRADLGARRLVDPRPIDEILAWDENGLPV